MLEDSVHSNIVAWGAKGDSFLVKVRRSARFATPHLIVPTRT
jgi:hypothetical protein